MKTVFVQLVAASLCVKMCLCQEEGGLLSFLPEIGDDQDFNFLGLFQIQPAAAETATVSTYALPGSSPNAVPAQQPHPQVPVTQQHPQVSITQQHPQVPITQQHPQVPIAQQHPQAPPTAHPVNNQLPVPGVTLSGAFYPQYLLSNNFRTLPQLSSQPQPLFTPSLTYPQVLGMTSLQNPICQKLMEIMVSQTQLGLNRQVQIPPQTAYFPQSLLMPASYKK